MVKNALKMQLEKIYKPVLDEMLKAMGYTTDPKGNPTGSFDGLTPEERDALKAKDYFQQQAITKKQWSNMLIYLDPMLQLTKWIERRH